MTLNYKQVLHWAPRILGILFAIFISLFALDVFGKGNSPWEALGEYLIHLTPTYILLATLIIAWKWELIGAILYALEGVSYIFLLWEQPAPASLLITGPLFVISGLFLLDWALKSQIRTIA